jgi:hypothetical protein
MAIAVHRHQIGIENTGQTTQVPDDPLARLQYYLSVVKSCIPGLSNLPTYLTNYANYRNLTREQKLLILVLADQLDLQTMVQAHIFIPDFDRDICVNSGNGFFKITDRQVAAIATSSAMMAGQQVAITTIMLFTEQ